MVELERGQAGMTALVPTVNSSNNRLDQLVASVTALTGAMDEMREMLQQEAAARKDAAEQAPARQLLVLRDAIAQTDAWVQTAADCDGQGEQHAAQYARRKRSVVVRHSMMVEQYEEEEAVQDTRYGRGGAQVRLAVGWLMLSNQAQIVLLFIPVN